MEFVILWIICGFICAVIASNKGLSAGGHFFIGVLLGPLGIVLSLVSKKDTKKTENAAITSGEMKKCPMCAELIKREAIRCKHCAADLLNIQEPEGKVV